MAKNKANVLDDSFDFDGGFADFDFDIPDPTVKDDRKPSIKIASGAKQGVKDTLSDPAFAARTIKKIFPPGYGQAYDEAGRIGQSVKNLYDEAAADIKPAIKQTKQALTRLIPPDAKMVPKALQKVLDDWRKQDQADAKTAQGDQQEAVLSSNLNQLFGTMAKLTQEEKAQTTAEQQADRGIALIRHRSILDALARTANATQSLDQYNRSVGVNVQKKSLELQYRQLFAQQDTLQWLREDALRRDQILLAISKNTGLPEFVKIRESEARRQAIKNKFYDSVATGLYGNRDQYIAKTLSGIKKKVNDNVKTGVQSFMGGLAEFTSMMEMTEGMVDPATLTGQVAGSLATDGIASWLGKKAAKRLAGSKLDNKLGLSKGSHWLQGKMDSLPNLLNEFRKSNKYAWGTSAKDRGLGFLQGLLPNMSPDDRTEIHRGGDLLAPAHFSRRTERSITEVIPGYLARIFRELQIQRSGDPKTPLMEFDHTRNGFARADVIHQRLVRDVVPKSAAAMTQQRLRDIFAIIDPNNTLDPLARKALQKKLLFNSADRNMANQSNLAGDHTFADLDPALASRLQGHMSNFFNQSGAEKLKTFELAHNRLADNVSDPRSLLQQEINLGNTHHLRRTGLLNSATGQLNLRKILSMYLDEERAAPGPKPHDFGPLTTPPNGPGPKGEFVGPMPNAMWYAKNLWRNRSEGASGVKTQAQAAYARGQSMAHDLYDHRGELKAEAAQTLKNTVQGITDRASELREAVQGRASQGLQAAKAEAKSLAQAVLNATQAHGADRNAQELQDAYMPGEEQPRLRKAVLEAGGYRLRTSGKIITSYNDLTEDVIDEASNEVLRLDEVPKLLIFDRARRAMRSMASTNEQVARLSVRIRQDERVKMVVNGARESLVSAMHNVKTMVEGPDSQSDLFVEGETVPRITKVDLQNGKCLDTDTNKIITKHDDITGDVKNDKGEFVLRRFELPKLRVFNVRIGKYTPLWFAGKLIKALWNYQTKVAPGMAMRNLKRLWNVYAWGGKALLGTAKFVLGIRPGLTVEDIYLPGELHPVMLGRVMQEGGYVSARSGKPILKPADIDGEVRDLKNQVVITDDEYKRGLYNIQGRKVSKGLIGKLIKATLLAPFRMGGMATRLAAKAVGKTVGAGVNAASWAARKTLGGMWGGAKALGRGAQWMAGIRYEGDADERQQLYEARMQAKKATGGQSLDDDTASNPKLRGLSLDKLESKAGQMGKGLLGTLKKRFGIGRAEAQELQQTSDLDKIKDLLQEQHNERLREKVRAGSYADQQAHKRAGTTPAGLKAAMAAAAGAGPAAAQAGSSKGLLDTIGDTVDGVKGLGKMARKSGGWLKNGAKWLMRGGRGLLGLGGLVGAGEAAAGVTATAAAGTAAAETAALAGGALAAEGTAAAAVAGGAGVLATIGGGLLAFLTSPVVLGVGALALVGYGTYRAVKYFRRGHLSKLGQLRCVQYGFAAEDTDNAKRIVDLEQSMMDGVKTDASGVPAIDESKVGMQKRMKAFDLDHMNGQHVQLFSRWYVMRFKPVFLTWLAAIKGMTGKVELDAAEDLNKDQRQKFLDAVAFANGPYQFDQLPLLQPRRAADGSDVLAMVKAVAKDYSGPNAAVAAATAAGAAVRSPQAKTTAPDSASATQEVAKKAAAESLAVAALKANQTQMPTGPAANDAEAKAPTGLGKAAVTAGASGMGTLTLAGGDMLEGRNADAFLKLARGVKLEGMNPQMRKQLMGMIEEYGTLTGKSTTINDGVRSYEDQVALKKKYGARAAEPGSSLHEYGLAADIDRATLDEMDRLGLMRKYGFVRPVGAEPWHMEPIGTQGNLDLYKTNPDQASQAVLAGAGKGGGGYGTVADARRYGRDGKLSETIMAASVPEKDTSALLASSTPQVPAGNGYVSSVNAQRPAGASSPTLPTQMAAMQRTNSPGASYRSLATANDGEAAPKQDFRAQTVSFQPDASAKVPDPTGAGIDGLRNTVLGAAKVVGVDGNALLQTIAVESDFNPNAAAGNTSAKGLMQFTDGTWTDTVKKYGSRYGYTVDNCSPTDAKAACLMGAHLLKDNLAQIGRKTNRPQNSTDAYMGILMGASGASSFLQALQSYPQAIASQMFPAAARQNPNLFTEGGRDLTIAEVYAKIDGKIRAKSQYYGLGQGPTTLTTATATAANDSVVSGPLATSNAVRPSAAALAAAQHGTPPRPAEFIAPMPAAPIGYSAAAAQRPSIQPQQRLEAQSMLKTENLLAQQLDVQQQLLVAVEAMAHVVLDKAQASKDNTPAAPAKPEFSYVQPEAPVSMKRQGYARS